MPFSLGNKLFKICQQAQEVFNFVFFLLQTYIDHFSTIFLQHTLSATHVEKLTTWLTQPHLAKILVSFWSGKVFLKHFLLLTEFSGTFIFCWPNWLTHPFLPLALPCLAVQWQLAKMTEHQIGQWGEGDAGDAILNWCYSLGTRVEL